MDWKRVLKVSLSVGLIVYIFQFLTNLFWFGDGLLIAHVGLLFAGILSAALIISKRLPKEEWAIFLGALIVVLLPFLIMVALDTFLGASVSFRYSG